MDETKVAIFDFIRDQNDKLITARESLRSKYANIQLLAGLLLTAISFSISVVAKTIENARGKLQIALAAAPLVFLALALYHLFKSLLAIPNLVGGVTYYIPKVEKKAFLAGLKKPSLDPNRVLLDLSNNYLDAIEKNMEKLDAGTANLFKCVRLIRRAVFATIGFLSLALLANVAVMWLSHK